MADRKQTRDQKNRTSSTHQLSRRATLGLITSGALSSRVFAQSPKDPHKLGATGIAGTGLLPEPSATAQTQLDVVSVNGTPKTDGVFQLPDHSLNSIRIQLTDTNNTPIEVKSPTLHFELTQPAGRPAGRVALNHRGDGIYEKTGINIPVYTEFIDIEIIHKEFNIGTSVAIVQQDDPLSVPIPGWLVSANHKFVVVGETEYRVIDLTRKKEVEQKLPQGWLILRTDGTLVEESPRREKAAFTAMVSETVNSWDESQLRQYAGKLRFARDVSNIAEELERIRNIAAEFIGVTLTSGTGKGKSAAFKQATKRVAGEFADKYINGLAKRIREESLAQVGIGDMKAVMEEIAEAELTQSAQQANDAADILATHDQTTPWTYDEARQVWDPLLEAISDGFYYMTLRKNLLPDADARSQLEAVSKNVLEGAGVPVSDIESVVTELTSLIQQGKLGYISETAKEAAVVEDWRADKNSQWDIYTHKAHGDAYSKYGDESLLKEVESAETGQEKPRLLSDKFESGAYDDGDPITWQVESPGEYITVQSEVVKVGERALEMRSAGGSNPAVLSYQSEGNTVSDGDVYSAWIRCDGQVPRGAYRIRSGKSDIKLGINSDHDALVIVSTENGSQIDKLKVTPGDARRWYLFEAEMYPSSSEINGRIYDSSESLLGDKTLTMPAVDTWKQVRVVAPQPFGNKSIAWFDDVTVG